ncbi:MAG: ATP-binding cassette domain-containing protein [Pseudomonadales bacterium]|nr:ATP-binding cassette domain-containing protein [Pseudomonadales bacterium]
MTSPSVSSSTSYPISSPLVRVENALCRIGRRAVMRISEFTINEGEHWCLFGPNGAGKSVLASLIAGQRTETGSYVRYAEGFDPTRDCLFVSFEEQQRLWQQDNRLDMSEYSERAEDKGTVVDVLIRSGRAGTSEDETLFLKLVAQLNLQEILQKGIRFLSSGQIRRVLIARALYAATGGTHKLVILDDPLEAIDKDSRQRIISCITEHQGSGLSSLLLCRRQQDVLPGVSHLALMEDLQITAQGERSEVESGEQFRQLIHRSPKVAVELPKPATEQPQPTAEDRLIELKGVDASYGDLPVLRNVSWTMTGADHVLIEGPNGCGKSTLLSLIDGENHKGYGQEVYLFGRRKGSGETVWDIKSRFGVVSNELHNKYVKGWKVLDVVVSGFFDSVGLYDDSGSAEWDGAREWLAALGIDGLEKEYYHELSFGQQRLVLLARAMVKHPWVLVLDEPCVGLDDYHRKLIIGTLEMIARQTHTRICYVSHVAGEELGFITQRLLFVPLDEGGFTVKQSALSMNQARQSVS